MKTKTRILIVVVLIWLVIMAMACARPEPTYVAPQGAGTPPNDPMLMVERFATGTSDAWTQIAQGRGDPMGTVEAIATQTALAISHDNRLIALTVILPDGTRVGFTLEDIEALKQTTIQAFDKSYTGVELAYLMEQTGWVHQPLYSLTLEGEGSLTFRLDRQPNHAVLYVDYGSIYFAAAEILPESWPHDIVLIIVR